MTEAERLADALDGWSGFIGSGYECPAAGQPMLEAAALLRSQAEELERLRRALGEIEIMETNWALGVDDNLERARRLASIVLGK